MVADERRRQPGHHLEGLVGFSREPPRHASGYPTKAMLLAAGRGTRLRPLITSIPKCMVPLAGKPVLEHTVEWLRDYGVTQLIVNLCYLPDAVISHFGDGSQWGVRISYSIEDELLGTAGGVRKAASFFQEPFYVWYGDNLSTCDLHRLYQFHRTNESLATIALHYREDPTASGIVGIDQTDRIVRFLEKPRPDQVFSHWVSAGIFVLEPEVLNAIPGEACDFGREIFPRLVADGQRLYGYRMSADEGLWWIDTPEDLRRVAEALAVVQDQSQG